MSTEDDNKRERARQLAEEALERYAAGDKAGGDKLAEEAAALDRGAVEEVVEEIDEDVATRAAAADRKG